MRIIFDHVPKTGGTSFATFLSRGCGDEVLPDSLVGHSLPSALALYSDRRTISGHFKLTPEEVFDEDHIALTLLREPLERVLSHYSMILYDVPVQNAGPDLIGIKNLDFDSFLRDSRFFSFHTNVMAHHYAGLITYNTLLLSDSDLFEAAKQGLSKFSFYGITEKLDALSCKISGLLEFEDAVAIEKLRVTTKKLRKSEIGQETVDYFKTINAVDYKLWQYAADTHEHSFACFADECKTRGRKLVSSAHTIPKMQHTTMNEDVVFLSASITSETSKQSTFLSGETAILDIHFQCKAQIDDLTFGYSIHHVSGAQMFGINSNMLSYNIHCEPGHTYTARYKFPVFLGLGRYYITISAHTNLSHTPTLYFKITKALTFEVNAFLGPKFNGLVRMLPDFSLTSPSGDSAFKLCQLDNQDVQFLGFENAIIQDMRGKITINSSDQLTLSPLSQFSIAVTIHNQGAQMWEFFGNHPCYLSYHWYDENNNCVFFEGNRTPLPHIKLDPNSTLDAHAIVVAPEESGNYILEITMVQEGIAWFENNGLTPARLSCTL